MYEPFYEDINKATPTFPHMEFDSRNLNYLSHFHEEIEIAYLVEGKSTIFCDNKRIEAEEGDLFIFMPGQIHSFISTEPNRFYVFKLFCKNENESTDFSTLRTAHIPIKKEEKAYTELLERFEELRLEITSNNIGKAYRVNATANMIVCDILRGCRITATDKKENKKIRQNTEILTKVTDYVEKNYVEKITIAEVADACGFSEFYFAHTFKQITGSTFFEYLTVFRLEKVISVHLKTGKSIIESAFECGFSNTRSFYRLFKKHFHLSPKEYVKQMNG